MYYIGMSSMGGGGAVVKPSASLCRPWAEGVLQISHLICGSCSLHRQTSQVALARVGGLYCIGFLVYCRR